MNARQAVLERGEVKGWVPFTKADYEKVFNERVQKWSVSETGQEELALFIGMKGKYVDWFTHEPVARYSAAKGCYWKLIKIGA